MIKGTGHHPGGDTLPLPMTIVALFNSDSLRTGLEEWAARNNCRIHWADPHGADIYAVGSFALIIDRNLLGLGVYDYYLQWCEGTMDVQIVEEALQKETGEREVIWSSDVKVISSDQVPSWRKEYCDDVCIFLDALVKLPLPQVKIVHLINPADIAFVELVVQNVEFAYRKSFARISQRGEE